LKEINANRSNLGDRLIEVRYPDLTTEPLSQLQRICEHFTIEPTPKWLEECCGELDSERKNSGDPIVLPSKLCDAFNTLQKQYGFEGEATEL
jgi:hypothetical protein